MASCDFLSLQKAFFFPQTMNKNFQDKALEITEDSVIGHWR